MISVLSANSYKGVELFMVIEGGVDRLIWSYFITELQKKVFPKIISRCPGMKKKDILLLYDNCPCHVSKFGGWWMRNLRCIKLTTPTYTPEVFFSYFYFIFVSLIRLKDFSIVWKLELATESLEAIFKI